MTTCLHKYVKILSLSLFLLLFVIYNMNKYIEMLPISLPLKKIYIHLHVSFLLFKNFHSLSFSLFYLVKNLRLTRAHAVHAFGSLDRARVSLREIAAAVAHDETCELGLLYPSTCLSICRSAYLSI